MSERGHTRGQFLGAGAALSAGALASTWRTPQEAAAQEAAPTPFAAQDTAAEGAFGPNFTGESFFLELDGEPGGFVTDVQGGFPEGQVVEVPTGSPNRFKKHIGNIKFSDVSFKFALTQQPKGLFSWISQTLDRTLPKRSGVIKACDADFRVLSQGAFQDALITEIGFPALDSRVKQPAYMTLKFTAETSVEGGGGPSVPNGGVKAGDANFNFALGGLSSKAPVKIDAFTIKQAISEPSPGTKTAAKISIPDLKVTLARNSGLTSWLAFYEDFLLEGNSTEADELTGVATLTNSKGTKELAQVNFLNMGILSAVPVTEQLDGEPAPGVAAKLYCEEVRFNIAAT